MAQLECGQIRKLDELVDALRERILECSDAGIPVETVQQYVESCLIDAYGDYAAE